jgi:hypothetical protein
MRNPILQQSVRAVKFEVFPDGKEKGSVGGWQTEAGRQVCAFSSMKARMKGWTGS